jgi:hypothetical protein
MSDRLAAEGVFLAGGLGMLCSVAARLILISPPLSRRPGRLAFFHALPIACATIVMTLLLQPELAFSLLVGSCISIFSGVAGFILISSESVEPDPGRKNAWIFVFIPALILFLMGLRDSLDEIDALILLALGALTFFSWKPSLPPENLAELPPAKSSRLILSVSALIFCCIGALLVVYGGNALQNRDRGFVLSAMGPTLLSIILCYPMISPGIRLANEKKTALAMDSHIAALFILIGLVLPILILLHMHPFSFSLESLSRGDFKHAFWITRIPGFPFPRIVWRIDTLALLILTLPYLPAAEGRLKFGMGLAFFLILIQAICFFANLTLVGL